MAMHRAANPTFLALSAVLLGVSVINASSLKRENTLSSLSSLVQQQADVIQSLQADLAAEKNRVTALQQSLQQQSSRIAALENKHPDPVAFTAHFRHEGSDTLGLPLAVNDTLVFDATVTNIGDGYDPTTGFFTAPTAGIYSFFLSQMSPSGNTYLWLDIVKEGTILDVVFTEGSGDMYDQGSSQVTTHLEVGEKVWVRNHHGDGVRGSWWTVFTGYLVQAD